jgi:transcription antitermination factor NusG
MEVQLKKYCWYVIYTRACHEFKAEEYLKANGIEAFLPKRGEFKQWSDRKKWVETSLFPSYIFVRVSCKEYAKALQHSSIVRYVAIDGCPCRLPDEQIEAIKTILQNQLMFEITTEKFEPGDSVVFCEGPLTGYSAEIVNIRGIKEVVLRIPGTYQSMLIKTNNEFVKKAVPLWPVIV